LDSGASLVATHTFSNFVFSISVSGSVSSINQLRNYAKSSKIVLALFEVSGINYAPVSIFMKIDFGAFKRSEKTLKCQSQLNEVMD